MNDYTKLLSYMMPEQLYQLDNEAWSNLSALINESVLADAHSKVNEVKSCFQPLNLLSRPMKKYSRVLVKQSEDKKYNKDFKVNCDFLAFRIGVDDPCNIQSVVDTVVSKTTDHKGWCFVRNNEYGPDIVRYVYAYIPSIGYMMEFQIGHPFAGYTFKQDSLIRDGHNVVDLWDNNFYVRMKDCILGKVTQEFDVSNELKKLYGEKEVPFELKRILSKWLV